VSVGVANGSKLEIDIDGEVVEADLGGCAIHMWELSEKEPVRHLEKSGSQRWSSVCMLALLRMSSWEDEIQLNRDFPALSEEMWMSQVGVMGIEITENKGVRRVWEKFREKMRGRELS